MKVLVMSCCFTTNRDLTDKPNRSLNGIESESGEESKGDINSSKLLIPV